LQAFTPDRTPDLFSAREIETAISAFAHEPDYGYEIPDGEVSDGVGRPAHGDDFRKGA
jgi:hypothetical protein